MRWQYFIVILVGLIYSSQLAGQVVFNRTEHDFGRISSEASQFEQDFIFRNTGNAPVRILSARAVSKSLQCIYTRSEVLPGEYGFVKTKLFPDSLKGIFHDEVYITLIVGDEVKNEVLYVRANIDAKGRKKDDRAFEDGKISTSVEVSPEDIETMEGFVGGDKLTQAASEITYLKRQVQLKSDLIAKLSDDLFQKQAQEKENFERLATLEKTLQNGSGTNNVSAISQLKELTSRLNEMRSSDSLLRQEIRTQESQYERLKLEADSARNYAKQLSAQLQAKFESEAKAIEKATQLEQDLRLKEQTRLRQEARIDSLTKVLDRSGNNDQVRAEIQQLKKEIELRQKEQAMQEIQAARQQERLIALKEENAFFKQNTDSLKAFAASRASENEQLLKQLDQSNLRISRYENVLDSLRKQTAAIGDQEKGSMAELQNLKKELASIEAQDEALKKRVAEKEQELDKLQAERDLAQKNMQALERTTTKQQEQAQALLHRINALSTKESEAQMEAVALRNALKKSQYKEDSTRQSVNDLVQRISEREASIQNLAGEISEKEKELQNMQRERTKTALQLEEAQKRSTADAALIDSLSRQLQNKNDGTSMLENDIITLQKQVLASKNKAEDYKDRASDLESKLQNAHLSNDLTFQELKGDVDAMRKERDGFKEKNRQQEQEIKQLKDALLESKRNEESALAFANELQSSSTIPAKRSTNVHYAVHVMSATESKKIPAGLSGEKELHEYMENGQYHYAIGRYTDLNEAIAAKEKLKEKGYTQAFIVAFKNGKRISLKEALEAKGT